MKRKEVFYIFIIVWLLILLIASIASDYIKERKQECFEGFNSELPQGIEQEIESSKSKAYETAEIDDSSKHIITLDEFVETNEKEYDEEYIEPIFEIEQQQPVVSSQLSNIEKKLPLLDTTPTTIDTTEIEIKPQKREFLSATTLSPDENNEGIAAIAACIHQNQKVKNGGRVKIRTLEKFDISGIDIEKGTILTGICRFDNDRVKIDITSIKSKSNIVLSKLSVYDNDGLEGIYYPVSQEENSIRNTGSNVTKDIGRSIGVSSVIGSVINGGVDYISDKASRRNVMLYSDYKIFLIKE